MADVTLNLDELERAAQTARALHLAIPGAKDDSRASGVVLTPEQITALIALAREAEGAKAVAEMNATSGSFTARQLETALARAEKAEARVAELEADLAKLSDPVAVGVNLRRGSIAKPDDVVFLYDTHGPVAARCAAARDAALTEAAAAADEHAQVSSLHNYGPAGETPEEKRSRQTAAFIRDDILALRSTPAPPAAPPVSVEEVVEALDRTRSFISSELSVGYYGFPEEDAQYLIEKIDDLLTRLRPEPKGNSNE